MLLANPCGKIADIVFEAGGRGAVEAWYGVTAYAFQIYFDFSGYSDMAIGLGLMFGFVFAKNFDSPYRSESITEFWHRWHISLSTWLRDYLYMPLGGNREGQAPHLCESLRRDAARRAVARRGVELRGVGRTARRAAGASSGSAARRRSMADCPPRCAWPRRSCIVLFTWVFFRAPDLPQAIRYVGDMLAVGERHEAAGLLAGIVYQPYHFGTFLLAGTIVWTAPQTWDWTRTLTPLKAAAVLALLALSADRPRDAGVQPLHLFHLLMARP